MKACCRSRSSAHTRKKRSIDGGAPFSLVLLHRGALTVCVVIGSLVGSFLGSSKLRAIPMVDAFKDESEGERLTRCRDFDWFQACENVEENAGERRSRRLMLPHEYQYTDSAPVYTELESQLLDNGDDASVVYDENCLRRYRLNLSPKNSGTTFPYHANHLLRAGGNQTMALFIQHGAMRDADRYFCSFKRLMMQQTYRPFDEILVIAPDFNYKRDDGVLPSDAFWNTTKPWGDWRIGAESDPECCNGRGTVSSFTILDHMLGILTDKTLYPHMNKISYIGHSAGGQMVQRYAIMSHKAAKWDRDPRIDMEFIVANPSSYTYFDDRRWSYSCGACQCSSKNCTCDQDCTEPLRLAVPDSSFVCNDAHYNDWPYGMKRFHHHTHSMPYVIKSASGKCAERYRNRHVVYMVGSNDTCNDALPTCRPDCWKREHYLAGEWPCYRNHMDTRCPAMLEGFFRRQRGELYIKHLQDYYGEKTHVLHVIEGVGHDATGMFGSDIGLRELFD